MGSVPLKPTCREANGPRCDGLLDDPEGVLLDPDKWPWHLCLEVARASCRSWARSRAVELYGSHIPRDVKSWTAMYPLPVGRMSLPPDVPPGLAVLSAFGETMLVIAPDIPFITCIGFGIVHDDGSPADMQFTSSGWPSKRTSAFQKAAGKWWIGESVTGRPRGHTTTRADAFRSFSSYEHRFGRPPNQLQLATELELTDRSLRDIIGDWATFKREASEWTHLPSYKGLRALQNRK